MPTVTGAVLENAWKVSGTSKAQYLRLQKDYDVFLEEQGKTLADTRMAVEYIISLYKKGLKPSR